ncbi:MAG: flagellar hook-length control protein [Burkholderiaceae bacterium]|nr:flagellar hook-length control protein [Burkholderiaceae bacterium]
MTIATSVVVKPSRSLLIVVGLLSLGVVYVGTAIGLGNVGDLPDWQRWLIAASCMLLAPVGFLRTVAAQKVIRLDISGSGQIRLRNAASTADACDEAEGILVSLLPNSTIWPRFLLLLLRAEDGKLHIVTILPDSLPEEGLRAVAVACRWVAAHNSHR